MLKIFINLVRPILRPIHRKLIKINLYSKIIKYVYKKLNITKNKQIEGSLITLQKFIEQDTFTKAMNEWFILNSLKNKDQLIWMRTGIRVLVAQSNIVKSNVNRFLNANPLFAALELSLLRKTNPSAYLNVKALYISFSNTIYNNTPLMLATESLQNKDDEEIFNRLKISFNTLEIWQLSKLFRYPLFQINAKIFLKFLDHLIKEDQIKYLSFKTKYKIAILAKVISPKSVFIEYISSVIDSGLPDKSEQSISNVFSNIHKHKLIFKNYPAKDINLKKKLNIALCLSGQLRGFREASKSYTYLGLDSHSVDIYIHTWRSIGRATPDPDILGTVERVFEPVSFCIAFRKVASEVGYDQIKVLYPYLFEYISSESKVASQDLEDVYKNIISLKIEEDEEFNDYTNQMKMHYKIWACNNLMKNKGINYDIVIRLRPDRSIHKNCDVDWYQIYNDIHNNNIVYSEEPFGLRENFVFGDQIGVSSMKGMNMYSSVWERTNNLKSNPIYGMPHKFEGHASIAHNIFYSGYMGDKLPGVKLGPLLDVKKLTAEELISILQKDSNKRGSSVYDSVLFASLK